jgi:hypothetical protein
MNIFYIDDDPVKADAMLCDRHICKMGIETCQMLCNLFDGADVPYKRTHYNHGCSKWVRESYLNFRWLIMHGLSIFEQYRMRYGREHKSEAVLWWVLDEFCKGRVRFSKEEFTTPYLAMPDELKKGTPVDSYRNYYIKDKSRFAKWKMGNVPEWFKTAA